MIGVAGDGGDGCSIRVPNGGDGLAVTLAHGRSSVPPSPHQQKLEELKSVKGRKVEASDGPDRKGKSTLQREKRGEKEQRRQKKEKMKGSAARKR